MNMIVAIIQARMGSTRLPNKVLMEINRKPLLWHDINRARHAKLIDKIVIATTTNKKDEAIIKKAKEWRIDVFAGSEDDVLDRYYQCAKKFNADVIVRLTGDDPLKDPRIIDKVIKGFFDSRADYSSNVNPPTFPDGLDVEVFKFSALEKAWKNEKNRKQREHVTAYIINRKNKFKIFHLKNNVDYSDLRFTVDNEKDLQFVRKLYSYFKKDLFYLDEMINILKKHPELKEINKGFERSCALIEKNRFNFPKSKALWKEAKKIIPGGTQLLSKRSEMFLPENWPSYFSKAKGVEIWDLDGNKYIDMSLMGIGACILGYADNDVDNAVKKAIDKGTMTTLNTPEEVELAKLLTKIHPWASKVRYSRAGGEAMAIAVRIARAYSGKDKVAFCGYHGWQDWYLASNLANKKNLDGHLLPGLEPKGVPRGLTGTAIPFEYNDVKKLKEIVKKNDVGVIVVEPFRHTPPENNFLKKVREIADKCKAVLIFDEITIGWRMNAGGAHLLYKVAPDIAVFGKAIANGFPMAAIIGNGVMETAQSTFISSAFWTERVGPVAAITTIKKIKEKNVPAHLNKIGDMIGGGWKKLAKKHDLKINVLGPNALITFSFNYQNAQEIKTLFTQEMLRRGFLASTSIYVSYSHKEEHVKKYLKAVDEVFAIIKKAIEQDNVKDTLEGPVAHTGFRRLTW